MKHCDFKKCLTRIGREHDRCPSHRYCTVCEKPARIKMKCRDHAPLEDVIRDTNKQVSSRRSSAFGLGLL